MRPAIRLMCLSWLVFLVACGNQRPGNPNLPNPDLIGGKPDDLESDPNNPNRSTIWEIFADAERQETTIKVNKFLWNASLEVLSFLPVESADPYTGVIVTGFGTPPGGSRAYRATIHVKDPALAPRSLNIALHGRNAPVAPATARAVEDAILARARQLRGTGTTL